MSVKDELLGEEDKAWHALCERVSRLTDEDFARPGVNGDWTPKDMLAHIAAWHALTIDRFEALRTTGELPAAPDVDRFNDENHARCRDLPLHDVRAMFEASRHRFREELAELPAEPEELVQRIVEANGHGHYAEHIPQLDAFLGDRA